MPNQNTEHSHKRKLTDRQRLEHEHEKFSQVMSGRRYDGQYFPSLKNLEDIQNQPRSVRK